MSKRIFDIVLSFMGIILLAPLLSALTVMVWASDRGRPFFLQERVGRAGRPFRIIKFRSMRVGAERMGPSITGAQDTRITRLGRILRNWKLDELPQLFNVLKGDMSLVGPRPEVPRYVAFYTDEQRRVLAYRPGITDLATLKFRDEEGMLARAEDAEKFYREYCIPKKIELNMTYAANASVLRDIGLIIRTLLAIGRRGDH